MILEPSLSTPLSPSVPVPPEGRLLKWYRCERKVRVFATLRDASEHAEYLTFHHILYPKFGRNPNIWPYSCEYCGGFHVGQLRYHNSRRRTLYHARCAWRRWYGDWSDEAAMRERLNETDDLFL